MALTGLDIFKLLPKTNCGDCGVPTCLAFAMKLAQKKAELKECPHASDQAKAVLGAAGEPPMRLLKVGTGPDAFEMGGETVMFRHEKTFNRQTALAVRLEDTEDSSALAAKICEVDTYSLERVGEKLRVDAFCLANLSQEREPYLSALKMAQDSSSKAIVLDCANLDTLKAALQSCDGRRIILHPGEVETTPFAALAQEHQAALIVSAGSMEELALRTEKIAAGGFRNMLLHRTGSPAGSFLHQATMLRRLALRKGFKPFGYPLAHFPAATDPAELLADAVIGLCKYSGLLVLPAYNRELLLTLLTLRQNIYTDPQKPIQVDPKVYAIGEPHPDSRVFVTTNFSLTYFIVSGEIENAGVSAWLVIPDCEGMSVLTAWAAGKFSGEKIGKFVREVKLESLVASRQIIIPGYAAAISGELEEALPGWEVMVGPQEAADIAPFLASLPG